MDKKQDNVDEWLGSTFPLTRVYTVPPEDMLWLHRRGFDPSDADNRRWVREGSPRYVVEYGRGEYADGSPSVKGGPGWRAERQADDKATGTTERLVGDFFRTPGEALASLRPQEN